MAWKVVLAGERVGRLVATRTRQRGEAHIACVCDCGTEHRVLAGNWSKTQSCGCLLRESKRMTALHNKPCDKPGHEREPNPDHPGRTRCRTCALAAFRRSAKKSHMRDRADALAAYGGSCVCCGERREIFLVIDHINEDGAAHRRMIAPKTTRGGGSRPTYRWFRLNDWPTGFQVLCWNCNYAKHRLGECPHQTERRNGGGLGSAV